MPRLSRMAPPGARLAKVYTDAPVCAAGNKRFVAELRGNATKRV